MKRYKIIGLTAAMWVCPSVSFLMAGNLRGNLAGCSIPIGVYGVPMGGRPCGGANFGIGNRVFGGRSLGINPNSAFVKNGGWNGVWANAWDGNCAWTNSWNGNGKCGWGNGWNGNGNRAWNKCGPWMNGWNGGAWGGGGGWNSGMQSVDYATYDNYPPGYRLNYATNSPADYEQGSDYRVPGAMNRAVYADLVVGVQTELRRRGFYRGVVNGLSDALTRAAIRSFEASMGIPVTGVIGTPLLRALGII